MIGVISEVVHLCDVIYIKLPLFVREREREGLRDTDDIVEGKGWKLPMLLTNMMEKNCKSQDGIAGTANGTTTDDDRNFLNTGIGRVAW